VGTSLSAAFKADLAGLLKNLQKKVKSRRKPMTSRYSICFVAKMST
jgi:fructose-1,6-bisphosphatase